MKSGGWLWRTLTVRETIAHLGEGVATRDLRVGRHRPTPAGGGDGGLGLRRRRRRLQSHLQGSREIAGVGHPVDSEEASQTTDRLPVVFFSTFTANPGGRIAIGLSQAPKGVGLQRAAEGGRAWTFLNKPNPPLGGGGSASSLFGRRRLDTPPPEGAVVTSSHPT